MSASPRRKIALLLFLLTLLFPLQPSFTWAGQKKSPVQNTVILWTDRSQLKAITLVTIKPGQKTIGIIAIPTTTRVENDHPDTLEKLYNLRGRQGLTAYLEKRFQTPIKTFFCIDQRALFLASELIGPITMFDKKTTMLDVFEGTYTEQCFDLQVEIRALAKELLEPEILVKIPHLIWIFTTHVETNLGPTHFLTFYHTLRGGGPNILRKEALPGQDYITGGIKYREVAPEAWTQVLKNVSRP
ncbi:MAG: hypothetical protein AB1556_01430 [Bacillota bacterium]